MELLLNSSMKTDLQSRTAITIEEWAEILPQFEELGGVLPQFEELVEDTPIWGGFFPPFWELFGVITRIRSVPFLKCFLILYFISVWWISARNKTQFY